MITPKLMPRDAFTNWATNPRMVTISSRSNKSLGQERRGPREEGAHGGSISGSRPAKGADDEATQLDGTMAKGRAGRPNRSIAISTGNSGQLLLKVPQRDVAYPARISDARVQALRLDLRNLGRRDARARSTSVLDAAEVRLA